MALFETEFGSLVNSMVIDLTTLKENNARLEFAIPADEIDFEDESVKLNDAARVRANITKGIVQTNVSGEIEAAVELECARCLQTVQQSLKFPFQAVFVTPENYTSDREVQVGFEDLEVSPFGGDKIDATELAREQILLAIPAQVFCREDCKGLCQKCGANKNLVDCSCEEKEVDPRWAALKDLK